MRLLCLSACHDWQHQGDLENQSRVHYWLDWRRGRHYGWQSPGKMWVCGLDWVTNCKLRIDSVVQVRFLQRADGSVQSNITSGHKHCSSSTRGVPSIVPYYLESFLTNTHCGVGAPWLLLLRVTFTNKSRWGDESWTWSVWIPPASPRLVGTRWGGCTVDAKEGSGERLSSLVEKVTFWAAIWQQKLLLQNC